MRSLLLILIFQVLTDFHESQPTQQNLAKRTLEVQIVFQSSEEQSRPNPCLNISVLIINHTDTVASFFADQYLWGYFNICFEISAPDTSYTIHKKDKDFNKNIPAFKTLFPGDTLTLTYSLDYGQCNTSEFDRIRPTHSHRTTIVAVYQLSKELLESAELNGEIKYKKIYLGPQNDRRHHGEFIIVDSLKNPVEVNRTFPISRLESKRYQLK